MKAKTLARHDLAGIIEIGLLLLESGLVTETAGNISVRGPDENSLFITPSRRNYRFLTERDLVRVHMGSGQAEGRWNPSSEWQLHVAAYRARPDVNAVIHHHAVWASAVAVARKTIPILLDEAADIGPIPTAPYAPSASEELAGVTSKLLACGSNAVLLANHGAVAVGRDLHEAFRRAVDVERLAKIYLGATLLGGAHALDDAAVARSREFFSTYRVTSPEKRGPQVFPSRVVGHVGLLEVLNYGFQAGVTFASLLHALILEKLRAVGATARS